MIVEVPNTVNAFRQYTNSLKIFKILVIQRYLRSVLRLVSPTGPRRVDVLLQELRSTKGPQAPATPVRCGRPEGRGIDPGAFWVARWLCVDFVRSVLLKDD